MNILIVISTSLALPYFVIKAKDGLVLTVKKGHVGFSKRQNSSSDQNIKFDGDTLAMGPETICASRTTSAIDLCVTDNPTDNKFTPVFVGNHVKFVIQGNRVLSVGEFNQHVNMNEAVINVESKTNPKNYMFEFETHE